MKRSELIEAAMNGVREYLSSTRGANACGAGATVVKLPNDKGFQVVASNKDVAWFDVTEF